MRIYVVFIGLLSLGVFAPTYSAQVTQLYEVRVQVTSQADKERKQALQEAIQQVLVKVSGHASTLQDPIIQSKIRFAQNYIKTYRYEKNQRQNGFWLRVSFIQNKINALLSEQQKPLWGSSRPVTLAWLVSDNPQGEFISYQDDRQINPDLLNAMRERGLPVRFPHRHHSLRIQQITSLAMAQIKATSKAYQADAIVAGKITEIDEQWQFYGRFVLANNTLNMRFSAQDKQTLMRKLASFVGESLARRYALSLQGNSQPSSHILEVKGINDFEQYHGLLAYLRNKTGIKEATPSQVRGNILKIKLQLAVPWSQVASVLRLDKKLVVDIRDNQSWHWAP